MSAPKLFSPGPVLVKANVRNALLHYDICHRSKEFEEMFVDTQNRIIKLFNADDSYYAVIVSGSGTSANETVLSSVVKDGESVMLLRNGLFGERLQEILDKYKIPYVDVSFPWATAFDEKVIEEQMKAHPEAKTVAMVFHETSTGMINKVYEVGQLCKKYGRKLFTDTVSAAAGQNIDVIKNNITFATSVGGKCLGAFPGSAYVIAKRDELEQLTGAQCRNVYLNLYKHYVSARDTHQTPNTPNVNLFWALQQALANIEDEGGLAKRIERYQECAAIIRKGLKDMGLRLLLDEKKDNMSNTVTSVFLPVDAKVFLKEMEERGYTFYIGKADYAKQNMIQVANMGEIYPRDCRNMLRVFKECLETVKNM